MGRRATTEDRLPVPSSPPSSSSKDGRHPRRRATTDDRPAAADQPPQLEKEGRQRAFGRSETFEERVRRKLEENEANKMNGSSHSHSRRPRHLAASMPADGQGAAGDAADAYAAEYEARVRRKVEGSGSNGINGSGHSHGSANGSRHRPKHLTSSMPNNTEGGGFEELLRRKMEEAGEGTTNSKEKGTSKYSLDEAYSLQDKAEAAATTPKKKTSTSTKSGHHVGMEDYLDVSSVSFELPYATLSHFQQEHGTLVLPASHPALVSLLDDFSSTGMEALLKKRWEYQFAGVKAFKREHGDVLVPASHPTLGKWMRVQREQYLLYERRMPTPLTKKRFGKLRDVGFEKFVKWEGATAAASSVSSTTVVGQQNAVDNGNDGIDETDSSLERNHAGAANQLTLEQRIEQKLAANNKEGGGDGLMKKDMNRAKFMEQDKQRRASNDANDGIEDTDSSLERNSAVAADSAPTLEERIEQKLAAANNKEGGGDGLATKDANRVKFMERGIQAHNSSDNKGNNQPKRRITKEEVAAELHRKRMLQRSLGSLSKRKVVVATELDAWREEEGGDNLNDDDGHDGGGLLRSYAHLVRSCSASNLCPGSWECPRCATVNEPLGLDPRTTCGVCHELKPDDHGGGEEGTNWGDRQRSFRLEEVVPGRSLRLEDIGGPTAAPKSAAAWMGQRGQESVDDINIESWSELGTVLTTAARQSVVEYMSRRRL